MVGALPYGMRPGAVPSPPSLDRLTGVLLGTALGDALGLPFEGLSARTIARRAPALDRYHLIGRLGVVSDDTQHAATLKACGLILLGVEVTHTDVRAIEGALFVGELAAACLAHPGPAVGGAGEAGRGVRRALVQEALMVVTASDLRLALERAAEGRRPDRAPASGFVVDSVATAVSAFVAHGDDVVAALGACIRCGGDTDSNAAILGGWLGGWHGAAAHAGTPPPPTPYLRAALWTWLLYPVIISHGFLRLVPR